MAEFIAFDKSVEVNGQTILSVLDGMTGFESTAKSILTKNRFCDILRCAQVKQQLLDF